MSDSIPVVLTSKGLQPQSPAVLRAKLVSLIEAVRSGFTSDLPGSLVEDIVSTAVYAIALCDSAMVELVNSVSPYTANQFILNQLAQIYGTPINGATNTSVYVVFSGPAGFIIDRGFTVSDGTYQYQVQDLSAIGSGGASSPIFCVATIEGSWAVPTGSVTQIATSVPDNINIIVTNPQDGTPGGGTEGLASFRARTLDAGLVASKGTPSFLKTLLNRVPNVQARLVSVQQQNSGWKIIVGGGDPYLIAAAIYRAIPDITSLVGSSIAGRTQTVTITDYPDTYHIPFVVPPQQSVSITLVWGTSSANVVNSDAVAQLAKPALSAYVNGISTGQPINLYEMQQVFVNSITDIVPPNLLTRMVFTVQIDGTQVPPGAGSGVIAGDPESFFYTTPNNISVSQG